VIRIGSLFSGIGGLELGLEVALAEAEIPARVAWQVEIDPFCRAVLARHWPEADRSVTDVRAASSLPCVDLLCGGFPCQDVSSAGRGRGLDGERSGLWFVMRDTVSVLRPRVVIAENVASGKRRYLCRVRSDLHALGYRTLALQLGASAVGAPHDRQRVFIVGLLSDAAGEQLRIGPWRLERSDGSVAPEPGDDGADVADADELGREQLRRGGGAPADIGGVGDPRRPGREGSQRAGGDGHGHAAPESGGGVGEAERGMGGGAHGLPAGLDRRLPTRWPAGRGAEPETWEPARTVTERDPLRRPRLRALGNAVVPAQARALGRELITRGWLP
jgi:DNA (cytosine-5)-methyltransferase 1